MSIIALFGAAFFFSLFGIFIREIDRDLIVVHQLYVRSALSALVFLAIGIFFGLIKSISYKDLRIMIFRGLLITLDFWMFIIAITHLPFGLTLFVFFATSILSNYIFGSFVLGEALTKLKSFSFLLALVGLYFIYYESFTVFAPLPLLAAGLSGFSFGIHTGSSKLLTKNYSLTQVNLMAYIVIFFSSAVILLLTSGALVVSITDRTWYYLIGFTAVSAIAHYLLLYGYKFIEAQKASLVGLSEILFGLLVGFLLYAEIPNVSTIIGGSFILFALALPNIKVGKN